LQQASPISGGMEGRRREEKDRQGAGSGLGPWSLILGLADGALLAKLGPAPRLARLLVILALTQFFLDTTSFQQLFEAAQGEANRFSVVDTHPQGHSALLFFSPFPLLGKIT